MATYRKDYVRQDIVAALTVAVVALPQSILEIIENHIRRSLAEGKKVILSGVRHEILTPLEKAHIVSLVGRDNVFMRNPHL